MGCVAIKKKEVKVVSSNESINLSTALSLEKLKESNQTIKTSKNFVLQIVPNNQQKYFSILKRTPVILDQQIIQFCYEEVCNKKKLINDFEQTYDIDDVLYILSKSFQEMNFRNKMQKLSFFFSRNKNSYYNQFPKYSFEKQQFSNNLIYLFCQINNLFFIIKGNSDNTEVYVNNIQYYPKFLQTISINQLNDNLNITNQIDQRKLFVILFYINFFEHMGLNYQNIILNYLNQIIHLYFRKYFNKNSMKKI